MFDKADLEAFVRGLIKEKNYESFGENDVDRMTNDLLKRLITQIDIACISQLSEEKAAELNEKLEQSDISDGEIADFMRANNVNIEEITSNIKNQFREAFLMSGSEETEKEGEE
ncbi:hypothetical protein IKP94_01685 [Candidatus Saccharibacteria bacterium]|nr:hypothetical protein [Candidatus Saccharibacteria bacterium]